MDVVTKKIDYNFAMKQLNNNFKEKFNIRLNEIKKR